MTVVLALLLGTGLSLTGAVAAHADNPSGLTAADIQVTTGQGQAITIQLQGSGPAGDSLTYFVAPLPVGSHGSLTGGFQSSTQTYTPSAGFSGVETFTYFVSDATSTSSPATVTVTVTPVSSTNRAPVATPANLTVQAGDQVALPLAGTDADGDPLTFRITTWPSHGSTVTSQGAVLYTPFVEYAGPDSVTYVANDGVLDSTPVTISITVTPARANTAPTSVPPTITTAQDTPVHFTLTASDADGDPFSFAIGGAEHGTVASTPSGDVTYTPDLGFSGQDRVYYFVTDGRSSSPDYWALITVTPTPPVVHTPTVESFHVQAESATAVPVTLQGSDPDGDALTYAVVAPPTHGTLSGTGPSLVYTSDAGYSGPDSFTYTASDGTYTSTPAAVEIDVQPVLPPPPAPVPDASVTGDKKSGTGKIVAPALTTDGSDDLVIALVAADGPVPGTQKVASLSGGGLTWSLVKRSNAAGGTAEIWAARAAAPISGAVVSAKLAQPGYDGSITVVAFGNATVLGTSAGASATHGSPAVTMATGTRSSVWAVGHDWSTATQPVALVGQAIDHVFLDKRVDDSFWVQSGGIFGATSMTVGDAPPTADRWELSAVELHFDS